MAVLIWIKFILLLMSLVILLKFQDKKAFGTIPISFYLACIKLQACLDVLSNFNKTIPWQLSWPSNELAVRKKFQINLKAPLAIGGNAHFTLLLGNGARSNFVHQPYLVGRPDKWKREPSQCLAGWPSAALELSRDRYKRRRPNPNNHIKNTAPRPPLGKNKHARPCLGKM